MVRVLLGRCVVDVSGGNVIGTICGGCRRWVDCGTRRLVPAGVGVVVVVVVVVVASVVVVDLRLAAREMSESENRRRI